MIDAEPQAPIVIAEMRIDRAQSIMAAGPTTAFDTQPPQGQIELVMDDQHVIRLQLEKLCRRLHGATGLVHISERAEEDDLLILERAFPGDTMKAFTAAGKGMAADKIAHRHETDIVAGGGRKPGQKLQTTTQPPGRA